MYYVYALESCSANYIYVGLTNDVSRRIHEHNAGYERTTKPYRPFTLLLVEEYATRAEARLREKFLKGGSGKEYLKSLQRIR